MQKFEIEYQRALVADLKKVRQSNAVVNKAINRLSTCNIPEIEECTLKLKQAKDARECLYSDLGKDRLAEIERLQARNKRRWMRVRSAVRALLRSDVPVLVTLTFTDHTLEVTSADTRRTYVRKFLSSQSTRYFANRDFGGKKGREHYHALCSGFIDPIKWEFGTCNVKAVKVPNDDDRETVARLAKYIDKLANHALKDTAEDKIIWSRGFSSVPHFVEVSPDDEEFLAWLDELGG